MRALTLWAECLGHGLAGVIPLSFEAAETGGAFGKGDAPFEFEDLRLVVEGLVGDEGLELFCGDTVVAVGR